MDLKGNSFKQTIYPPFFHCDSCSGLEIVPSSLHPRLKRVISILNTGLRYLSHFFANSLFAINYIVLSSHCSITYLTKEYGVSSILRNLNFECIVRFSTPTEGSLSQKSQEKESSNRAPLNSGQWDSDWDSDFSLHVQPLSDLTSSSSEDDQWKNGTERRTSNQETQQRTRKASDKTSKAVLRREERKPSEVDLNKSTLQGGAVAVEPRRKSAGETHVREKKSSRKIIVKPIPSIGPGIILSIYYPKNIRFCVK